MIKWQKLGTTRRRSNKKINSAKRLKGKKRKSTFAKSKPSRKSEKHVRHHAQKQQPIMLYISLVIESASIKGKNVLTRLGLRPFSHYFQLLIQDLENR